MSYAVQTFFSCFSAAMVGFGMNDASYGGEFSSSMGFNAVMGVSAFFSLAILPMSWYCITEEKGGAQSGRKVRGGDLRPHSASRDVPESSRSGSSGTCLRG